MNGKIVLRLKNDNRTGKFEAKIIGHEGDVHCSDGLDEALLRDILEAEIDGFDEMIEVKDGGKTNEHFEEKQKNKFKAKGQVEPPFPEEEEKAKKEKDLSLGFGV